MTAGFQRVFTKKSHTESPKKHVEVTSVKQNF